MTQQRRVTRVVVCVAVLTLIAAPAFAEDVIYRGADLWKTTAGGFTHSTFAEDPIPADFFCQGSQPFTGAIAFEGAPLHTEPAGRLGTIDTIVERLDDAVFNDSGVATTRIRLMALSLVGSQAFENECGAYRVTVSLDGEQPITEMRIFRDSEYGGTYEAPLEMRVKVSFLPIDGQAERREVSRDISLGPGTFSVWSEREIDRAMQAVRVDTDFDGRTDRAMPPASNFAAGVAPAAYTWQEQGQQKCPYVTCHCNKDKSTWDPFNDPMEHPCTSAGHAHCNEVIVPCEDIPDRRLEPRGPVNDQPMSPTSRS